MRHPQVTVWHSLLPWHDFREYRRFDRDVHYMEQARRAAVKDPLSLYGVGFGRCAQREMPTELTVSGWYGICITSALLGRVPGHSFVMHGPFCETKYSIVQDFPTALKFRSAPAVPVYKDCEAIWSPSEYRWVDIPVSMCSWDICCTTSECRRNAWI